VKSKPSPKSDPNKGKSAKSEKDADTRALEDDLTASLGMKVEIDHAGGHESGRVTISYRDFVQLDELCRRLADISD
jgi:ParB family chromosome partitioning protein